jgi:hypothetical protein
MSPLLSQYKTIDSHLHPDANQLILDLIKPETGLEKSLITHSSWIEGAFWGEPRKGHPEGKVIFHVREVLDNVDRINVEKKLRSDLRLIAIIHDNFKHLEEQIRPRQDWSKHHAVYAMKFAKNFPMHQDLLNVIEMHDEAYYAWHKSKKNESEKAEHRLKSLMDKIGFENLQLFYLFFKCDTFTGDKNKDSVHWFENQFERYLNKVSV